MKLDCSFPERQFLLEGMRERYKLDVSAKKGGLFACVNKNVSSKYLQSYHLPENIQTIYFFNRLKQRKLLVVTIYWLPDQNLYYFLSLITTICNITKFLLHLVT